MIKQRLIKLFVILFILLGSFGHHLAAQRKPKESKSLSEQQINQRKELFMNAAKERILGNWVEAEQLYRAVLNIDPDHDASMYELARIYGMANRPGDAVHLMEKAIEINPDNEWYYQFLADLYKQTYQIDKLMLTQESLINRFPDKIEYRLDLAMSYIIAGDFKKAIAVYDEIEDKIGKTEDISLQKHKLYLESERPKQALAEIEGLVSAYPENVRYLQILAESYLALGQESNALDIYKRIAEIEPDNPFIHISLADLHRSKGEDALAIEELKLGFANPDLDLDTKIQVMLSFFTIDEFYNTKKSTVLELSTLLADAHPDDTRALSIYGEMLYRNMQYEKALEVINEVLEKDISSYSMWEQKLFIENDLLDSNAVLATSNSMIELFPMQPIAYLFNGFAHYQLKDFNAALRPLETGLTLVVDNNVLEAQFYSTLGDVYNRLSEFEKSDESYEKALELKPDDAFILNNYSYYLSLRGQKLERAREMAALANQISPDKSSFQDTYGWVLFKLGEYAEAEKWIKKALDSDEEDSAVLLEHYGDVLFKLGRKDEALQYWIKAGEKSNENDTSEFLEKKIRTGTLYE
ncbi:MAG: tetratricopeptide repeat protein [Bacteroidales bacterium]|nr:tetratricopeptide repeat protein [Bacteroidales bacterium]